MELRTQTQVFEADEQNFQELVIDGSHERLVVVDFWAPWCGPCRTLGPILEEVVTSLGPGVALAKVNVDENQRLAMMFRVQGIPAVKIIKDGRLVQQFTGALPKEQVESLLRSLLPEAPPGAADFGEQAHQQAALGNLDQAARLYQKALKDAPEHGPSLLGLARVRLQQGDFPAVQELVNRIEEGTPEHQPARALLTQLEFVEKCRQAGGRAVCAQNMLANPNDSEARYCFACCAAAEGEYETALKEWLTMVERKKDLGEGAAKKAMVAVFHILGREHELVAQYQRKLYQALY
jgi:putative thioredoxin